MPDQVARSQPPFFGRGDTGERELTGTKKWGTASCVTIHIHPSFHPFNLLTKKYNKNM